MTLREMRIHYGLSQADAAAVAGVPIRTYRRYENEDDYGSILKRIALRDAIDSHCRITEERGILTVEQIRQTVTKLFDEEYPGKIDFCYLFGSYAKGTPKDGSDVDLYVSSTLTGLYFVGLIERLREELHKKVDLIRGSELNNNLALTNEILKTGIKIYG